VDDLALYHLDYSADVRARLDAVSVANGMATKPVVRGEVGLYLDLVKNDLLRDLNGVWLHNLTWATLDPGAMLELWWELRNEIATPPGPDGEPGLYEVYSNFSDFVDGIPLNNGHYEDAKATLTDSELRVTGQKDLVHNRAHVWIQNKHHTWRRVVDGDAQTGLRGTVTISGLSPSMTLPVEWHQFTTQGVPNIVTSTASTDSEGTLTLNLPTDPFISDVAIKIGSY
jgi:hypothetical protein